MQYYLQISDFKVSSGGRKTRNSNKEFHAAEQTKAEKLKETCVCAKPTSSTNTVKVVQIQKPENMPEADILEAITLFKTAFDEWKQIEEIKHEGSEARLHVIEGKVQESGEVSSARLAAIEDKMKDSVETSGSRGIKAVHFSGAESEDVNEFIIRFAQMGTFYKWEEARMLAALPLYLTGNATAW